MFFKWSAITLSIAGLIPAPGANAVAIEERATGGYIQNPSGNASFTMYTGCGSPGSSYSGLSDTQSYSYKPLTNPTACGRTASGYTAAISQLAFGSAPGLGAGDACGRCFAVTGQSDPYSPSFSGPFHTIIVKVTDLCPVSGNQEWCGQTQSNPRNQRGASVHFDICQDTGGASAFFPSGHGALLGTYQEVSCSQWSGSNGNPLWNGACLDGDKAANWPAVGCGNKGIAP